MTRIIVSAALVALAAAAHAAGQQDQAPAPATAARATTGLSDLEAVTFSCPKAALNAAARRAADAPSQGTYQFSYFRIVNNTHHAAYEVHFKSNYAGEADLKYCVAMYCQQGFDPATTKATITLQSNNRQSHGDACMEHQMPATRGGRK
jgi:hypothetical protein